ncbi:MAG: hypothetical protein ACXU9X_07810 [Thermodesulfobacteriota bacterium]
MDDSDLFYEMVDLKTILVLRIERILQTEKVCLKKIWQCALRSESMRAIKKVDRGLRFPQI